MNASLHESLFPQLISWWTVMLLHHTDYWQLEQFSIWGINNPSDTMSSSVPHRAGLLMSWTSQSRGALGLSVGVLYFFLCIKFHWECTKCFVSGAWLNWSFWVYQKKKKKLTRTHAHTHAHHCTALSLIMHDQNSHQCPWLYLYCPLYTSVMSTDPQNVAFKLK